MSATASSRRLMSMPTLGLVRPWRRADRAQRASRVLLEQRRGAIARNPALPKQTVELADLRDLWTLLGLGADTWTVVRTRDQQSVSHRVSEHDAAQTPEVAPQPTHSDADVARRLWNKQASQKPPRNVWAAIGNRPVGPSFKGTRSLHTLLVVDDDERVLAAWKRVVRKRNVITAIDTPTARRLASTEQPDLAIVDLKLGSESGIDLIRELKRALPDLTVVLCSGYLSAEIAEVAMRAGAYDVVVKPITPREILWRIEEGAEQPAPDDTPTLAHAEAEHITRVLGDCRGNLSMTARRLGIHRSSLQRALLRLGKK